MEVLDELKEREPSELQHLGHDDVLESRKFPEVLVESSTMSANRLKESLYRVDVDGLLSLHGVSNHHSFFCQVAFGVGTFRAHGEFTPLQTDYDVGIASIAGGTLKLQDELKFRFYGVGRQQN